MWPRRGTRPCMGELASRFRVSLARQRSPDAEVNLPSDAASRAPEARDPQVSRRASRWPASLVVGGDRDVLLDACSLRAARDAREPSRMHLDHRRARHLDRTVRCASRFEPGELRPCLGELDRRALRFATLGASSLLHDVTIADGRARRRTSGRGGWATSRGRDLVDAARSPKSNDRPRRLRAQLSGAW